MQIADVIRKAGGASRLARELGLHHTTVLGWTAVPPRHVPAVATLIEVSRHELRPDLWEPASAERAGAQTSPQAAE